MLELLRDTSRFGSTLQGRETCCCLLRRTGARACVCVRARAGIQIAQREKMKERVAVRLNP